MFLSDPPSGDEEDIKTDDVSVAAAAAAAGRQWRQSRVAGGCRRGRRANPEAFGGCRAHSCMWLNAWISHSSLRALAGL